MISENNFHFFSLLNTYKYQGEALDNYQVLIELLDKVALDISETGKETLKLFAKYLLIEARQHIIAMSYSKKYEMASDIFKALKIGSGKIIELLPDATLFKLLFESTRIDKEFLESNPDFSYISHSSEWNFYLENSASIKKLRVLVCLDNMHEEEHVLTKSECFRIENHKQAYEMLYSIANSIRTKYFISLCAEDFAK